LFAYGNKAVCYGKGAAMNQLRSLVGIAAVSSTLLVSSVAGAASAGASASSPAGAARHRAGTSPSVCYEVETKFGEWKSRDQGCDGKVVAPSGGVHGIAITVDGVKQVLYSASPDGIAFSSGDNGDKVNSGKKTTKLRAELSPRMTRHLKYTVTFDDPANNTEVEETKSDNQLVGDGVNVINTISIKITHD
jgi:hypothetical protein